LDVFQHLQLFLFLKKSQMKFGLLACFGHLDFCADLADLKMILPDI